jgi:nucleoside-diphosphate-sugar epimerase
MRKGSPTDVHHKRVLITGIRGFTGEYLAEELQAGGLQVFGTARPDESISERVYPCDISDATSIGEVVDRVRPDRIVHLAAVSFVGNGDAEAIYNVNLIGTLHLLQALSNLPTRPSMVLLTSSAQVYGSSSRGPVRESHATAPVNHYAASKLAMEHMARLWSDRLPITILRPFNYTGVGQPKHFLLPKIVEHYRRHATEIELGNLDVARDFSDVRDVVRAYRLLLEASASGRTINICSGKAYSLRDILEIMAEIAGYKIDVRVNPDLVRANDVKRLEGDPTVLRSTIGAIPCRPLAQTLRWMFEA